MERAKKENLQDVFIECMCFNTNFDERDVVLKKVSKMTYYNIEENVFQKFLVLAFMLEIGLNVVRNEKNQEHLSQ